LPLEIPDNYHGDPILNKSTGFSAKLSGKKYRDLSHSETLETSLVGCHLSVEYFPITDEIDARGIKIFKILGAMLILEIDLKPCNMLLSSWVNTHIAICFQYSDDAP